MINNIISLEALNKKLPKLTHYGNFNDTDHYLKILKMTLLASDELNRTKQVIVKKYYHQ